MFTKILDALLNLIKIKSLFSLMTIFIIIYSTIKGELPLEYTMSIITLIIGFYFNKKDGGE